MSERYYITGVQLGMLTALDSFEERKVVMEGIVEDQFLGNAKEVASPKQSEVKPSEGTITENQMGFIKKLQEEGYIPEDFKPEGITKVRANEIIKLGIAKRDSVQEGDY